MERKKKVIQMSPALQQVLEEWVRKPILRRDACQTQLLTGPLFAPSPRETSHVSWLIRSPVFSIHARWPT